MSDKNTEPLVSSRILNNFQQVQDKLPLVSQNIPEVYFEKEHSNTACS